MKRPSLHTFCFFPVFILCLFTQPLLATIDREALFLIDDSWEEPQFSPQSETMFVGFYWDVDSKILESLLERYSVEQSVYKTGVYGTPTTMRKFYGRVAGERHPKINDFPMRSYSDFDEQTTYLYNLQNPEKLLPKGVNVFLWLLPDSLSPKDVVKELNATEGVLFAELNEEFIGGTDDGTPRPTPTMESVCGGVSLGDGWYYQMVFGYYFIAGENVPVPGFLYLSGLGWAYLVPAEEGFWLLDVESNMWFWTSIQTSEHGNAPVFPCVWNSNGGWYFFNQDAQNSRWFFDYTYGTWRRL